MIEKIRIRNFQIHRDLTIEFGPGVTTIVGSSDVGKSSVLRAFRWLVTNRPLGDAFKRHGSKWVGVRLWFDDQLVERVKGKANTYKVDGAELKSFGTDPPALVEKLLGLSDVNFQGQHDPPYWLSLTAGEASKRLNEIVDLSVMDETLTICLREVRKSTIEAQVLHDQLDQSTKEMNTLADVPEMERTLEKIQDKNDWLDNYRQNAKRLCAVVDKAIETDKNARTSHQFAQDSTELAEMADQTLQAIDAADRLSYVLDEANRLGKLVNLKIGSTDRIKEVYEKLMKVRGDRLELKNLITKIDFAYKDWLRTADVTHDLQQEIDGYDLEICPECRQPILGMRVLGS